MKGKPQKDLRKALLLLALLRQGEKDVRAGRTRKTSDVFARLSRKHGLNLGSGD